MSLLSRTLSRIQNIRFHGLAGSKARNVVLLVTAMTLHSACEGAGVGVSFFERGGRKRGSLVALALGIHNLPECLGVAFSLLGTSSCIFKKLRL